VKIAKKAADAKVFREVARYCERNKNKLMGFGAGPHWDGACDVLRQHGRLDLTARFQAVFVSGETYFLMSDSEEDGGCGNERAGQKCRILALCFAADMVETGDL
jgi:hypothetical protein